MHDRGKVLLQAALMAAGGGESCLDIEHLRAHEDLFGHVPTDSTLWRAFHELTPEALDAIAEATARVRAEVWGHYIDQDGDPVDLDCAMRAHAHVEDHPTFRRSSASLTDPTS